MALPDPYTPGPFHLPRHLHVARWACIAFVAPVALAGALSAVLLWKLAHGPVDITAVSRLIEPVSVVAGKKPGHPAGRLSWTRLRVQWQPSSGGISAGLMLEARGLTVARLDGTPAEQAGEADTVLALAPLLQGIIAPRRLRLQDVTLVLRRQPNGDVDLDLPSQKHGGRGVPTQMDRLAALDLKNVSITLLGLPNGQRLLLGPIEAHGQRLKVAAASHDYLWNGWWRSSVRVGSFQTLLTAKGGQTSATTGQWHLTSTTFRPSGLNMFAPAMAAWDVPLTVGADIHVVPHGMGELPASIEMQVALGAGHVAQKEALPVDLRDGKASLHLVMAKPGTEGAARLSVPDCSLTLADTNNALTHLHATADLTVNDLQHIHVLDGNATASLDGFDFATLGSVWPAGIIKGGRKWIAANITSGQGRDLTVRTHLHTNDGLSHILPTSMDGQLLGHDMTVHWLRPVPPATGIDARLGFDGFDTLVLDLKHGQQVTPDGIISIPDGQVRIGNLYEKGPTTGDIKTHLQGSVAAFRDILSHPRLHLLSRHPLPFTEPSGTIDAEARLTLPLTARLKNSDIHVQAKASFANVHLGNVLMGRPVDGASGTLGATENGLNLTGDGRLSGIPVHVALDENFQQGAPGRVLQDIRATALLDPLSAVKSHLVPAGLFTGHATLSAHYIEHADTLADLALSLNMEKAGITVPVWTKPEGEAAVASAHIGFRGHDMVALDGLQAHGQTLSVAGRGVTQAGRLSSIIIEGFRLGRSEGDAQITLPREPSAPIQIALDADPLDLAPLFDPASREAARDAAEAASREAGSPAADKTSGVGDAWSIDLHAPRVYFGPKGLVGGVVSHIELRNGSLTSGRFALDAPSRVRAVLADTGRRQPFVLDVDNLGALLKGLGLYDRIGGGVAHLDGNFLREKAGTSGLGLGLPPFRGQLEIGPFQFLQPPFTLTAVSDLSPLHWSQSRTDRFSVSHVSTKIALEGRKLVLRDGTIGNQALGATVEGPVDLDTSALALHGTIVPLFGLNALPGKLPGIGHILAPEKGGGVLAATFDVTGVVGQPELTVNPLSMLLPGVLRKILQ
ncbi:MAG: AsmA-like C-terminal region-containing protein [Gluconobacter cerinus]|uniref:YhdP family protein n=1 Tax=Gluconobacter cerinus TaxID=38307 RepID=UPI0039EA8C76